MTVVITLTAHRVQAQKIFFTLLFWAIFKHFSAFRAVPHCSPCEQKGNSGVGRHGSQPIGQCANGSFVHVRGEDPSSSSDGRVHQYGFLHASGAQIECASGKPEGWNVYCVIKEERRGTTTPLYSQMTSGTRATCINIYNSKSYVLQE
ncbi:hypothetical protein CXB36_25120 [Pseudomonas syringae pv. syringae]|nr:hypothetical protein BKC06_025480 [Pseudomonas syringae pv. syringae]MCF5183298.1 hypothetical protein [Pseudomonas syringae]MCF5314668.1 hypothetical protein [Pseudomonas syringae]MCF5365085.1 hypothetical protein [Pseudomonas syringae]MCF5389448.1 hypothetical protein [Pseudomonas syringae]